MSLKPYTNGISILEVGDQPCVFRHGPENERYGIVTRITVVILYRTPYSYIAFYRLAWLEYSLFVLARISNSLSFEKWTSYPPDMQLQTTKHEERRKQTKHTNELRLDLT